MYYKINLINTSEFEMTISITFFVFLKNICQNVTNLPWPKSFFWCRWINRSTRQLQELQTNWQHFKSNALSWRKISKIKCSMSKFDNANKKSNLFSTSMFSKLNYYGPAAACFYKGPLELLGAIYPLPPDFGRYNSLISIRGMQIMSTILLKVR